MNNELLLLIKKHTDTLIEYTKTKPQETLEFKMNKQIQTFLFNPPISLLEEGNHLLVVSSFECINAVFNITNENNSFSIIIPGHYRNKSDEKTINDLNKLLDLKFLELHVEEVKKRGNKIKIGNNEYKLSDCDTQKNEILEKLKNVKYNDLKDLVYRMRLNYDEVMDILDLKYIPTKRTGYSLDPGIHEVIDLNITLKNVLPDNVKVSVTIDDIRLKSNLKPNQTLFFTKKSFFYTILGFTRSRSYPLDDIDGFYQLIAGSYKSDRPINITGIDKIHLKCDCIQGSIVNGIRKNHSDTLIQQTRTNPQETLEFKMNKQRQTFSFNLPINLIEEDKWLLAVSSFECTNSVFNITDDNNSFSIIIPAHWETEFAEKFIDEGNRLLEFRSLDLHVNEVRKRGNKIKIGDKEYKLSDFDNQKYEIIEELKKAKYKDLRGLVYRMQLTYDGIIDVLDLKYIPTKRTGYSLNPGI